MTKYDCYELCVQSPPALVPFLVALHGNDPKIFAEDFCGSCAASLAWLERVPGGRAIGTDLDPEPLARARERNTFADRLALRERGVLDADEAADVVFVGNFSIGEIHDRPTLVRYLSRARERLNPHGIFVCDIYGGDSAFTICTVNRGHRAPGGLRVLYTWEQRDADPLTGMVTDVCHFRVERSGQIIEEYTDAFVYRWRLWSVPELRDAMAEAGFRTTEVHSKVVDPIEDAEPKARPITDPSELEESFIVFVIGRM